MSREGAQRGGRCRRQSWRVGDRGQKWNVGLGMRLTDASAPVSAGAVGCWGGAGGGRKSRAGEGGGPVAMVAGTAGAQPAGA